MGQRLPPHKSTPSQSCYRGVQRGFARLGFYFFQGVGARVRSGGGEGREEMQISTLFTVHKTHGERGRLNHREGGGGRRAGAAGKHLKQQTRKQTRVTATTKEKS